MRDTRERFADDCRNKRNDFWSLLGPRTNLTTGTLLLRIREYDHCYSYSCYYSLILILLMFVRAPRTKNDIQRGARRVGLGFLGFVFSVSTAMSTLPSCLTTESAWKLLEQWERIWKQPYSIVDESCCAWACKIGAGQGRPYEPLWEPFRCSQNGRI